MLNRDLLRFRITDGEVRPSLLRPVPSVLELASRLLDHWRGAVGLHLGEAEDAAVPILHATRSLLVAKGLQKLVLDACTVAAAESAAELRQRAFAISARRLLQPAVDMPSHSAAVAAELGCDATTLAAGLYADLPDYATLTAAPTWTAAELVDRYNLALCQGLLLSARELTVHVRDPGTAVRRRLLTALRWHRLLALPSLTSDGALHLVISGPTSVLDQASRYGLNLALFLPALATCQQWDAAAWIRPGREAIEAELKLDQGTGLRSEVRWLAYQPTEVQSLHTELATKHPDWKQTEPALLTVADGELVLPDLQLEIAGGTYAVELFHRWHRAPLLRRLAQLRAGALPGLCLGVDRALVRTGELAVLADDPWFATRGFLFNDLPTVRALERLFAKCAEPKPT